MGKRPIVNEICGVMGCRLPNLHAGMHQTAVLCSKRGESDINVSVNNTAIPRISPCVERNETRITSADIELEIIKSHLKSLKKQVDHLCKLVN